MLQCPSGFQGAPLTLLGMERRREKGRGKGVGVVADGCAAFPAARR